MSLRAMSWVFEHSDARGGARLVLLALAEHAHDDGSEAYPSVETLAARTRMSRQGVQKVLRRLEAAGALASEGRSRTGTTIYRVLMAAGGQQRRPLDAGGGQPGSAGGPTSRPVGGQRGWPEPTTEPSFNRPPLSGRARADGPRPVTFRGRRVPDELVGIAERLLGVFSERSGRSLSPRRGDGTASPALRQVVGALLAHPDVTEDTWIQAVTAAVEHPPDWVDGQLQTGHVFGEKAALWTLAMVTEGGEVRVLSRQRRRGRYTAEDYIEAGRRAAEAEQRAASA